MINFGIIGNIKFDNLLKRFSIKRQEVILHLFQDGLNRKWTLHRKVLSGKEMERCSFEKTFCEELFKLLRKQQEKLFKKSNSKGSLEIVVGKDISIDEVNKKIKTWNAHCESFWAGV